MPTSDVRRRQDRSPVRSFIEEWCNHYGLDSAMLSYLRRHGYTTGDDLLTLYVDDIRRLPDLDDRNKCLLRGAILQYRQSRSIVDKEFKKKGVIFENKSKEEAKKRNVRSVWRHHAANIQKMDAVVMSMLSPEQRQAIRQLRRRLHNKRTSADGKTLYQRILERRRTVLNVCLSNESANSYENGKTDDQVTVEDRDERQSAYDHDVSHQSSTASVYMRTASESQLTDLNVTNDGASETSGESTKLNTRLAFYHVTPDGIGHRPEQATSDGPSSDRTREAGQSPLANERTGLQTAKRQPSKPSKNSAQGTEIVVGTVCQRDVESSQTKPTDTQVNQRHDLPKEENKSANVSEDNMTNYLSSLEQDRVIEEELSKNLDAMLQALLLVGLNDADVEDPDAPEVDLEESQKKTEEVLRKLERDLFTEDEKAFVAKLRQLQLKYDNVESADYEKELLDLMTDT